MSQKSSVPQAVSSVSQVLKRDTDACSALTGFGRSFLGWVSVSAQKVEAAEGGARNQDDHGKKERGIEEQ
jgi:hypothetical protein